jgi:hypothetical protein
MANVKIELNNKGIIDLFKSDEVVNWLDDVGKKVASAAGTGYAVDAHKAGFTAIANVYADTKESARKEYKENNLIKAIGTVGLPTKKPHL